MHASVFWACLGLGSLCLAEPGTLSLRTYRNHEKHAQALRKRDAERLQKRSPFTVELGNIDFLGGGFYYVNASVGTPPQEVALDIDTGSSDVWMFGIDSCDENTSTCSGGTFDERKSSTLDLIAKGIFKIQYFTQGSGVVGDYVGDNFSIGGQMIKNLTMGVATKAVSVNTGIMGIGFDTNEALYQQELAEGLMGIQPYPNLLDQLKKQGLIGVRSYSLYLDSVDAATGSIVFGGYDKAKFEGDLGILDIQPDASSGLFTSFGVILSSVGLTDSSGSTVLTTSNMPNIVVLDSGTAFTIIPADLLSEITTYLGAVDDETYSWIVRCDLNGLAGTLDYQFAGPTGPVISVPFEELVLPILVDSNGDSLTDAKGNAICRLGLSAPSQPDEPLLFGDTFLRSAYVVYDLDNLQIGIAQTIFNETSSNIVAISAAATGQSLPGNKAVVASTPALTATQAIIAQPTEVSGAIPTTIATGFGTGGGDAALTGYKTTYTNRATNIPGATTTAKGAGSTGSGKKNGSGGSTKDFAGGWWRGMLVQGVLVTAASLVGARLML
ncbi:acid protease [Stipitochalara longipes BDJ]|nr:acid protease [Stipitochalara longipes BDJ]